MTCCETAKQFGVRCRERHAGFYVSGTIPDSFFNQQEGDIMNAIGEKYVEGFTKAIVKAAKPKNECLKTRPKENPYEVWKSRDGSWTWYVLKKYQVDDNKPFARWFCYVTSPFCQEPYGEYGDTYVKDVKEGNTKVSG